MLTNLEGEVRDQAALYALRDGILSLEDEKKWNTSIQACAANKMHFVSFDKKRSTIVEKHENKYAFCLTHDHQHHEYNFDKFCYSQ